MYGTNVLFRCRVVGKSSCSFSSGSPKKLLEILASMPKANSERIASAQRQRQQISKKAEKYGPSTVYLQVLGSGAKGAPNTLYLFTDQKRYMFNCGECTQRLAHEHKVKLSRLDHIFITTKTWKNIGGLPGLSLTLQDVGVPNITLHGPEGLDELYNATKRFVIMKDMNVTMAKSSPTEDFEDNVMTVKYVLLGPLDILFQAKQTAKKHNTENTDKQFEEFIHDDTDYYNTNKSVALKEKQKLQNYLNYNDKDLKFKAEKFLKSLQNHVDCSVAYICTLKKRLGTLDLAKCVELGVKPGPLLGQLKSGKDVILPNGNLVQSKDVKTPDDPGPVFIVLDVPDISYIHDSEFKAHFDNGTNPPENIPVLIVHFTPPDVFQHPAYTKFISKFGPKTQHLILNSKNSCLGSEAVHRTQHKLHLLDPDIFPLLRDVSVPAVWNSDSTLPKADSPIKVKCLEELKNKIACAQFQNIFNLEGPGKGDAQQAQNSSEVKLDLMAGRTLTMYHLRPNRQIDRSAEPKLHIQEYIKEAMDVGGFAGSLEQFRRVVDGIRYAKSETVEYPKVVFLGTGSCIPSKTRNTSAIVIHIDETRSILLDCGEGTYGQLVRFYGPKKVNAFLKTLKAVYISHLHADHHIGLIGVLQARRQVFQDSSDEHVPVYLLAPGQIVTWLNIYDHQFEHIRDNYTLIPNQSLLEETTASQELTPAVLSALGLDAVRTCRVAHCPNAFGVAITINREKITYSGDTLPCDDLVTLGENSSLLIHEATMEDELADEARTKMHSTTTQAIDIGRRMKARYTVLTHFSQRYARLPRLNANILNNNRTVGIAFDNMQITMSDLALLPHMYAPLQLMFADHCVEMELKAAHRQLRELRESTTGLNKPKRLRDNNPTHHTGISENSSTPGNFRGRTPPCRTIISAPPNAFRKPPSQKQIRDVSQPRSRSRSRSPACFNSTVRGSFPMDQHVDHSLPQKIKQLTKQATQQNQNLSSLRHAILDKTAALGVNKSSRSPSVQAILSQHTNFSSHGSTCQLKPEMKNIIKSEKNPPTPTRPRSRSSSLTANAKKNQSQPKLLYENSQLSSRPRVTANTAPVAMEPSGFLGCETNGYGKPLVTPIDKRLIIKKDVFPNSPLRTKSKVSTPTVHQPRSVTAAGCEKLPAQGTVFKNNRVWNSSSNGNTVSKIPVLKNTHKLKAFSTSLTTQNIQKPAVNANSTGSSKSDVNKLGESRTQINNNYQDGAQGNKKINTPESQSRQETKIIKNLQDSPPVNKKSMLTDTRNRTAKNLQDSSHIMKKTTFLDQTPVKYPSKCKIPLPNSHLDPYDDPLASAVKAYDEISPTLIRNIASPHNRTMIMHSTIKNYKPQLEDIKSSYLLLNKQGHAAQLKTARTRLSTNAVLRENKSHLPKLSRPTPLNEELRQKQLLEAKNKFSTKTFYNDSRYEKIEGLNWISWK